MKDRVKIMKKFIFLTIEGSTFQPDSNLIDPDIENVQVVGFAEGIDAKDAFENLIEKNPYLTDTSFDEIFSMQLTDPIQKSFFYLSACR